MPNDARERLAEINPRRLTPGGMIDMTDADWLCDQLEAALRDADDRHPDAYDNLRQHYEENLKEVDQLRETVARLESKASENERVFLSANAECGDLRMQVARLEKELAANKMRYDNQRWACYRVEQALGVPEPPDDWDSVACRSYFVEKLAEIKTERDALREQLAASRSLNEQAVRIREQAVAKTVEKCAKVADDCELGIGPGNSQEFTDGWHTGVNDASVAIAEAIRKPVEPRGDLK